MIKLVVDNWKTKIFNKELESVKKIIKIDRH